MKIPRPETIMPSPKALRFAFNYATTRSNIADFGILFLRFISCSYLLSLLSQEFEDCSVEFVRF